MESENKKLEENEYNEGGVLPIIGSIFIKIVAVSSAYCFGYFNWSVAWLMIPAAISVIKETWAKSEKRKRDLAKAVAMTDEKELITACISDLPPWVFFPDIERAEWLNKILHQMWPNVNNFAQDLLKNVVEPKLQEVLSEYKVGSFRFNKLRLGTIPPRIGGIKVYDNHTSRSEIMMDVDIFYAGDCDISFYVKGVSCGVKDFQLRGTMRVIMKPLIPSVPLIGGVQVFFLNRPSLDFNLVGVGDILDMPGISHIIRKVIVDQTAAMMVLPNKFSLVLSDIIHPEVIKLPDPEGVLRVHVVQATKLMKKDIGVLGKGKSDPYVIMSVGSQEHRSQTINNTVNPKWDFWCDFMVFEAVNQTLVMKLFDEDDINTNDEDLGSASIELNNVLKNGEVDTWKTLENVKHGMVHVRLFWYSLSTKPDDLQLALDEMKSLQIPGINSATLTVFIDSVQNLPDSKPNTRPDPVLTITARNISYSTGVQFRTNSPVYEQGFSFLIHNPLMDSLTIQIKDFKTGSELGFFSYKLGLLLQKPSLKNNIEPFTLNNSGANSKILFSAQLKIVKKIEKTNLDAPIISSEGASLPNDNIGSTDLIPNGDPQVQNEESIRQSERELETSDSSLENLAGGTIRRRNIGRNITTNLGSIELTYAYNEGRQRFLVTVHRIKDLLIKDPTDLPDPYVKLYLLPKSKDTKRKTKVIKDSCDPVYEESFDYIISKDEIPYRQLSIAVISQKTSFVSRGSCLGQVILDLKELNLNESNRMWFDLMTEND